LGKKKSHGGWKSDVSVQGNTLLVIEERKRVDSKPWGGTIFTKLRALRWPFKFSGFNSF